MLKIRLRRMGKRHRPFYRVVVSDSRSVPAAPAVDEIGHYDPMANPPRVRIDLERVEHWAGQGAQLSPAIKKLVKGVRTGRLERAVAEKPKKAAAPKAAAEAPAEAQAPAEEAAPTLSELADEPKSDAVAETAGASDEEGEATPPPASPEAEVKAAAAEEPAEKAEAAAEETPAKEAEAATESQEEPEPETKKGAAEEDASDK